MQQEDHVAAPGAGGDRGDYELGVLFVYGIGGPRQGDTLVQWADAIGGWLARGPCDALRRPASASTRCGSTHSTPSRPWRPRSLLRPGR